MKRIKKGESKTQRIKASTKKTIGVKPPSVKEAANNNGLKKKVFETKNVCRVTFRLPKAAAPNAKNVCIVGDFNNWNIHANPMKKLKNGKYSIILDLKLGREYQFRYLIDETIWENDWNADKYVRSSYGDVDNSIVMTC